MDDLHNPRGIIAEAQQLTAELYHADRSFLLVNGTSGGLLSLILSCCGQGDKIIVPRNAHKSILSGLVLSGAVPIYYHPAMLKDFFCLAGPDVFAIEQLFIKHTGVKGVVAVHPTYYGVAGDLHAVADCCHGRKVPLLVDEAHGAHLKFHPDLPPDALSCGADAVVQSTHKTGGSLTQSSILHIKGPYMDGDRLAEALSMVQSTSPSYLLMASLDVARRQLALRGKELLDRSLEQARWCRDRLTVVKGVKVLDQKHLGSNGAKYLDPTRVTISLLELGLSGYQAAEHLSLRYGVFVEMADYASVVAVISLGTAWDDCRRLVEGIKGIAQAQAGKAPRCFPEVLTMPEPVMRLTPREAWYKPFREITLEQSQGQVSTKTVAVYPPGIPVICPGEEVTGPVLEFLREVHQRGYHTHGLEGGCLRVIL